MVRHVVAAPLAALGLPRVAAASDGTLIISLDREAAAPGEPFACEVQLTLSSNSEVEGFHPPEFKGLRVLQAPQFPSRSTQMQIGGGQTVVRNDFTWRYQLMIPPGTKGPFTIGGARVRVGDRDVKSNTISVRVGAGPSASNARRGGQGFPFDLLGGGQGQEPSASSSSGGTFVRVVADKTRAYVGEPVVVTWSLCTTQRLDKFDTVAEARTDGFWSEDVPSTNPKGRLAYSPETIAGKEYQVATLYQKALFPLREGKLTVTPLEAEVSQVDFFGSALRTQRLKADPVTIEALPLPREGQPAGFDAGNVGKYELAAHADRTTVPVGEAVTVTVEVKGIGNVRNLHVPPLAVPAGWKSYPPKETVALDAPGGVGGTKLTEVLLLPERAGTVMIPSTELPTFDPATKRYVTLKSEPLRLDVTGEPRRRGRAARGPGAAEPSVENVIAAAIRPIRARTRLERDVGTTFLRSRGFGWLLFLPPIAFGLTVLIDRVRGAARRSTRAGAGGAACAASCAVVCATPRRTARPAAPWRSTSRSSASCARCWRRASGAASPACGTTSCRRCSSERGLPADATARLLTELEGCDQARFAPGGEAEGTAAMSATLARADELIGVIEKAPLREEGPA